MKETVHIELVPSQVDRWKTRHPLILTARVVDKDIEPFDRLRQAHFPPDHNYLRAHLTMFHRLPAESSERIIKQLERVAGGYGVVAAEVSGLRHLGGGVAYSVTSPPLQEIHAKLTAEFLAWLARRTGRMATAHDDPEQGVKIESGRTLP